MRPPFQAARPRSLLAALCAGASIAILAVWATAGVFASSAFPSERSVDPATDDTGMGANPSLTLGSDDRESLGPLSLHRWETPLLRSAPEEVQVILATELNPYLQKACRYGRYVAVVTAESNVTSPHETFGQGNTPVSLVTFAIDTMIRGPTTRTHVTTWWPGGIVIDGGVRHAVTLAGRWQFPLPGERMVLAWRDGTRGDRADVIAFVRIGSFPILTNPGEAVLPSMAELTQAFDEICERRGSEELDTITD